MKPPWSLQQAAGLEAQRTARSGRPFALLRIAPAGWAADGGELEVLENVVAARLRRTDFVARVSERELGVVLIDLAQADGVASRLREVLARDMPGLDVRMGWGAVGPGQERTWQEGWRWAGQLLVADGTVRAAA